MARAWTRKPDCTAGPGILDCVAWKPTRNELERVLLSKASLEKARAFICGRKHPRKNRYGHGARAGRTSWRRIPLTKQTNEALKPIEVLIVDDHPMVREGLAGILARHQITIAGLAANGRQAVEMYATHKPDVVLLDLRLPDQSGFEVIRTVLKSDGEARIVILSSSAGDASIYTHISLGAKGYLVNGIDGAALAN